MHIGSERLLKLASYLRGVNDNNFNMSSYIGSRNKKFDGEKDSNRKQAIKTIKELTKGKLHKCGTTACAMGYTPAVFPKDFKWTTERAQMVCGKDGLDIVLAAYKFFNIDYNDYNYLFMPGSYEEFQDEDGNCSVDTNYVADRIEKFVFERELEKYT